jgi:hypothetical protein
MILLVREGLLQYYNIYRVLAIIGIVIIKGEPIKRIGTSIGASVT